MKITVDSKSLVEALQWATKNFDARDDRAFVALSVSSEGEGLAAHTNVNSYMKSPFTVLSSDLDGESLELALQGQFVQRLAGALDTTGPSDLSVNDGVVKLKNKLGTFTLPTFTTTPPKEPAVLQVGSVENAAYFDAVQRLAKLCDPASSGLYPVLGTVDLSFSTEDETATLMATDRYTLGEVVVGFSPASSFDEALSGQEHLLLPYSSAILIAANKASVVNTDLVFEPKSKKFGYSFQDGKVALFSLQEADALPYGSLKTSAQEGTKSSLRVSTKELQKAIATISMLVPDENDIFLVMSDEAVTVTDANKTNTLEVTANDVAIEGEVTVKFIRSVLNKVFAPVATASMGLAWESATSPFVVSAILEDGKADENVFVLAIPSA